MWDVLLTKYFPEVFAISKNPAIISDLNAGLMNEAQVHLLLNHFPIIGTLFGVLFLAYGLFAKNKSILHAGLLVLFLMALLAIPTLLSGEGAEEIVERLGVDHEVIHAHEEAAGLAIWFMSALGLLALATLLISLRTSGREAVLRGLYVATLVLSVAVFVMMARVGSLGGEIRHTEVRD